MAKVLLISEDTVKTISGLNNDIFGKSMLPAIREAQEIGLQGIIGHCLYERLCSMVEDGSIADTENAQYKSLLDNEIKYYLVYKVIADLIPIIGVKLGNLGVVVSNDEHIQNLSEDERANVNTYYTYRADFYCKRLQEYLLNNRELYPELQECDCNQMKANLDSASSIGLWLGGFRHPTKRIRKKKCC